MRGSKHYAFVLLVVLLAAFLASSCSPAAVSVSDLELYFPETGRETGRNKFVFDSSSILEQQLGIQTAKNGFSSAFVLKGLITVNENLEFLSASIACDESKISPRGVIEGPIIFIGLNRFADPENDASSRLEDIMPGIIPLQIQVYYPNDKDLNMAECVITLESGKKPVVKNFKISQRGVA